MLIALITTIHVIVCLILIVVVLIQSGKGGDLGAAFSGGSQTAFGPRGAATWASRATTAAAIIFMITSISLAVLQSRQAKGSSVMDTIKETPKTDQKAPPPVPVPVDKQPDTTKNAPAQTPAQKPAPVTPKK